MIADQTRLSRWLLPSFRSGHTLYVDYIKNAFRSNVRWLDARGGAAIFHDLYDGERELVAQSRMVVCADYELASLKRHVSVSDRVACDLTSLPLKANSFDLVTCGMVVEHMADPLGTFRELARILDIGGQVIVHTVSLWNYQTLLAVASKIIPHRARRRLIARITARNEEDIFPTRYRCNTRARLSRALCEAGLTVKLTEYLPARPLFRSFPILNVCELVLIRMLMRPALRGLRPQLLIVAQKPSS